MVTTGEGNTTNSGNHVIVNPHFGAAKGTLQFVIKDGDSVISTDPGSDHRLFFSQTGQVLSNYSSVKNLTGEDFDGTLSSVDADSGSSCSSADYNTAIMFYDENNDGIKQDSEKKVYSIVTDGNGCFGAKLEVGAWDIYG